MARKKLEHEQNHLNFISPTPIATHIICIIDAANTSEFDTHISSADTITFHRSLKKFLTTIKIQFNGIIITTIKFV